jgi:maleylacetoacetate isomerase
MLASNETSQGGKGTVKLYSFWRSLATFRVRIALNLKQLEPEVISIDLIKGEQRRRGFQGVNPQMLIPVLVDGAGPALFQSLAIMEYLDERYPQPPLLPAEPRARARVRGLAQIVACDCHPLIVPRVRSYLEGELRLDEQARLKWVRHWIAAGLDALETHLSRDRETGRYCHGNEPSIADICLVSHAVGAQLFDCDVTRYATVDRIVATCLSNEAFSAAHPLKQPGAPATSAH